MLEGSGLRLAHTHQACAGSVAVIASTLASLSCIAVMAITAIAGDMRIDAREVPHRIRRKGLQAV